MKLFEVNQTWTRGLLQTAFKAAKSGIPKKAKTGGPKVDEKGNVVYKASPLTTQWGQQKALRDADNKIIGAGGPMHDPMSPEEAQDILAKYVDDKRVGKAKPYGQLPDEAFTYDAVRNRARRSAPNRPATWKDGEGKDARSALYGKKRIITTPSANRRVTRNAPARKPTMRQPEPARLLTDPEAIEQAKKRFKNQASRNKAMRKAATAQYGPRGKGRRARTFKPRSESYHRHNAD